MERMDMRKYVRGIVIAAALLSSQMGHGDGCCGGESSVFGPPTESVCPPNSTLTYNNFGKPFMESYCTKCHDSEKVGEMREGAPSFHDFDTLNGIKAVSNHIDETAASGPAATNTGMPENNPKPSLEERQALGEWIACGMPE
jgi:hypothetical protein